MTPPPDNPWLRADAPRGADYDAQWEALAASGAGVHGEADLVAALGPRSVLDAGCGTGRVAVELARRGIEVVGVDLDPAMLAAARAKSAEVTWIESDLARVDCGRQFDVAVAAGNVMIFLEPGTEAEVIANLARHLRPGGALVAGFQLRDGGRTLGRYDELCAGAGLSLEERWATWERAPFTDGGDYAVSVHRAPGSVRDV